MSVYDDPIEHAKRLLTFHKDKPWAIKELSELVPLLLKDIEDADATDDLIFEKELEIGVLEERVSALEISLEEAEEALRKLEYYLELKKKKDEGTEL